MPFAFETAELVALAQVILIDVVLSGDNAIVIGMAVAGLPMERRGRIIAMGVIAATLLRVAFASVAVPLLQIIGLLLAGGILLLWVAWRMWRELRAEAGKSEVEAAEAAAGQPGPPSKTPAQAIMQIVVADVSMSLDNVLAVAGAARDHPWVLFFGLALSIALMAVCSGYIARLLDRYHWLAYVGLVIITYVSLSMIWEGGHEIYEATASIR